MTCPHSGVDPANCVRPLVGGWHWRIRWANFGAKVQPRVNPSVVGLPKAAYFGFLARLARCLYVFLFLSVLQQLSSVFSVGAATLA